MAGADVLGGCAAFSFADVGGDGVDDPVVEGVFFDRDVLFAGQKLKIRPILL